MHILVNPLKPEMDPAAATILLDFLSKSQLQHFFAGMYKHGEHILEFQHEVILRQRKAGKPGWRAEFFRSNAEPLGTGSFGRVFRIDASLITEPGALRFKPYEYADPLSGKVKKRVIKIMPVASNPAEAVQEESRHLAQIDYLAAKPLVLANAAYYLVMRALPGVELFAVLNQSITGCLILSLAQRLELSLRLIDALNSIAEKGIIHRDLKPENILVDLKSQPMQVHILDFGFAMHVSGEKIRRDGSPTYAAPEVWKQLSDRNTPKLDIYSLGRILALVWHADFEDYNKSIAEAKQFSFQGRINRLFTGLAVPAAMRTAITATLLKMVSESPSARATIQEVLVAFKQIEQEFFEGSAAIKSGPRPNAAGPAPKTQVSDESTTEFPSPSPNLRSNSLFSKIASQLGLASSNREAVKEEDDNFYELPRL